MRGVPGLRLAAEEYTITPSESARGFEGLSEVLSGGDREEHHLYDVVTAAGDRVLEVVRRGVAETFASVLSEEGLLAALRMVDQRWAFRSPSGETHMTLERGGLTPTYTLLAADTGDLLATWDRPSIVPGTGAWQLRDPAGEPRAAAEREGWLGGLVGSSGPGSYPVHAPDGTAVAVFDRGHPEGGLLALALSEMDVTLTSGSLPPEVAVAFAFGILKEAQRGSSGSGHDPGP